MHSIRAILSLKVVIYLDNIMHCMLQSNIKRTQQYEMVFVMNDRIDDIILEFLKNETLQGRLESSAPEIANGANLVYNHVGRALERLIMKDQVGYRERGTERKMVRYYYLKEVADLYRDKYKA